MILKYIPFQKRNIGQSIQITKMTVRRATHLVKAILEQSMSLLADQLVNSGLTESLLIMLRRDRTTIAGIQMDPKESGASPLTLR